MSGFSMEFSRLGSLLLAGVILFEPVSSRCASKDPPLSIVNFHPTTFEARAAAPFFYSIGNELKYSDSIDPDAPTLFIGKLLNFQVSPDGKRIAFVSDHRLTVIDNEGKARTIGPVDSIFRSLKPIGRSFIRDDDFQWSPDSKSVYFVRDKFYRSKGAQLFSELGALWKFDLASGEQEMVIKPFRGFQIIFGGGSEIYFAVPLANGDLELELYDGAIVRDFAAPGSAQSFPGMNPFYSLSSVDYMEKVLPGMHLLQDFDWKANRQTLVFGDKILLQLTRHCDSFFGCGDCDEMMGSMFIPGNRFFLLNVPYCRNYEGELLIDTQTGSYKTLPKGTRVFITANTQTYPHYKFDHEGLAPE
jgi:hypothetical protein